MLCQTLRAPSILKARGLVAVGANHADANVTDVNVADANVADKKHSSGHKKRTPLGSLLFGDEVFQKGAITPLSALDLASLHALGANISTLYLAVNLDGDLLDIRTEGTIGNAVGVADVTTSARCLTADLTNLGHS